jgi:hypothetical protein
VCSGSAGAGRRASRKVRWRKSVHWRVGSGERAHGLLDLRRNSPGGGRRRGLAEYWVSVERRANSWSRAAVQLLGARRGSPAFRRRVTSSRRRSRCPRRGVPSRRELANAPPGCAFQLGRPPPDRASRRPCREGAGR